MYARRRIPEPQSVRFSATQDLRRTANVPDDALFTVCGWARLSVDRNDFSTLCAIANGTSSPSAFVNLQTGNDGTGLTGYSDGAGPFGNVANLTVGRDFFWALTASGGTNNSQITMHYRTAGAGALTSLAASSAARTSFTPAVLFIGESGFGEPWNGRIWNVMCWDRSLTASELLFQSFYQYPVDETALNFWWPMDRADDIRDYSNNRRDPTITGTFGASEPVDIVLRNRVFPKQVRYAPGGTQSFSYTAAGGIALSGAATAAKAHAISASGGLQLSGTAPRANVRAQAAPSGGLTLGGAAAFGKGKTVTPAGGLALSGAASQIRVRAPAAAGGINVSGSAGYTTSGTQLYSYAATGGMQFGGAAVQVRVHAVVALGGLQLSGAASVSTHEAVRTVTPSGGLQFGGAAAVSSFTVGGGAGGDIIRRRRLPR